MCDCGSELDYTQCCGVFHHDVTKIEKPEQLMRARYCAFVRGNDDFIIQTDNPSIPKTEEYFQAVHATGLLHWVHLVIINTSPVTDNEGVVTFRASYIEKDKLCLLEETSRFQKIGTNEKPARWFYMDGEANYSQAKKIGRNDLCPCQSGKKYKHCCAKRSL